MSRRSPACGTEEEAALQITLAVRKLFRASVGIVKIVAKNEHFLGVSPVRPSLVYDADNPISAKSDWIRQICAGMALFTCSPVAPQLRLGVVSMNGAGFQSGQPHLRSEPRSRRERATFSKSNRILRLIGDNLL